MKQNTQTCSILFLLASFSGSGGERVMIDVANGLARRGHRVRVIALSAKGAFAGELDGSVEVITARRSRLRSLIPEVWSLMRQWRPDAVIATNEHTHIVLLVARMFAFTGTRTILRVGIPLSLQQTRYQRLRDRMIPLFSRLLYRRADALIAVSHGVARDLQAALSIRPERVHVIYHPKDITALNERAAEAPRHPWLAEKAGAVIVSSGRLRTQKGFDVLINALAQVREHLDARLVIFGEGGERPHLEAMAKELRIEDAVSLPGFASNVPAELARTDVYALASRWEGLPGALMEAMALGVPVVASDCPYGPRELLAPDSDICAKREEGVEEARHGLLVPVDDAAAMADALSRLLVNESMREQYAHAARARASDFSADDRLDEYERVLCTDI